jgi:hypothetical protein
MNPEDERATGTARMLVSCYLDDSLNVHAAIREIVDTESRARLCRVIYMLVGAVGDTFDGLDDFSTHIVDSLADDTAAGEGERGEG